MTKPVTIWTDGVVALRPLTSDDLDAHLAGQDRELDRWLSGGHTTRTSAEACLQRCVDAINRESDLGIVGSATGRLIGTLHIDPTLPVLGAGQVNLAYGLHPGARGRGFATRAVLGACALITTRPNVRHAVIRVDPANPPSTAVARRAGFTFDRTVAEDEGTRDWYVRDLHR